MYDQWIVEKLLERDRAQEQCQIQLPLQEYLETEQNPVVEEKSERGVVVIENY